MHLSLRWLVCLAACSSPAAAPDAPAIDAVPDNDAATLCGPGIYPCGPYGYTVDSTIANFALIGQRDDNANGEIDVGDTTVLLDLAHVSAGAQALVIDVCAEWCAPCRQSQASLDMLYTTYTPRVAFYDIMQQDRNFMPADLASVDRWGTSTKVPYPTAADPTGVTEPYFALEAFPLHVVVRTSDMHIVYVGNGGDTTMVQMQIDQILAHP